MSTRLVESATTRAELVARSLMRHRLVFVQMGSVFEPLRDEFLNALGGIRVSVTNRQEWVTLSSASGNVVVTDLEQCAETAGEVLGEVRAYIFRLLDEGKTVCILSRAPRIAFRSVPGSSVLEDAALVTLPLLGVAEIVVAEDVSDWESLAWPSVTYGLPLKLDTYRSTLNDLDQGLIAALDHALFEVDPRGTEGLEFLAPREVEGLRGAGLVSLDENNEVVLALSRSSKLLREALAAHVSETFVPATILFEVSHELWFIERRIRNAVRTEAIKKLGPSWRASVLGGLSSEVLRRAQLDTNVTAKSVTDLRDPLEWLTLGELMDIVRSTKLGDLGVGPAIWRKLQEQLIPIRNRLAHVRMLKSEDAEVASMWATLIKSRLR